MSLQRCYFGVLDAQLCIVGRLLDHKVLLDVTLLNLLLFLYVGYLDTSGFLYISYLYGLVFAYSRALRYRFLLILHLGSLCLAGGSIGLDSFFLISLCIDPIFLKNI